MIDGMIDFERVAGYFWAAQFPEVSQRGELTAAVGENIHADLQGGALSAGLTPGPGPVPAFEPGDMAGALRAYAAASVARWRAITIHGQLDTRDSVTLFDAHNQGLPGLAARYIAPAAIFGAHVSPDELYSAVRFRLDDPVRQRHLTDGESSVVNDDQSVLCVEASPEGNWLIYEASKPTTLWQLEIRVVASCQGLAQLALYPDKDLVISETEVRINSDSEWLPVYGPAFRAKPTDVRFDTLLPSTELTVERFATWIELNDRFDGIAFAVGRDLNVALQAQVQVLTSLVEGFHRRLPYEQDLVPKTTNKQKQALQRVRGAAVEAAAKQAGKEGLDRELISKLVDRALGNIGEKSYLERAEEIIAEVRAVIPEISEAVDKLPQRIRDSRNAFAHQLPQDEKKDPLDERVNRWIVVSKVTPWLLRALLLLKVGVDPVLLHRKYLEFNRFAFYRANTELRVRELGWDPFPAKPPSNNDG
jgi:hypothetical protein